MYQNVSFLCKKTQMPPLQLDPGYVTVNLCYVTLQIRLNAGFSED